MTHPACRAEPADHPVLHAAIALAPQIRAMSEEIERGRRIPKPLAEAMQHAGIFGMAMPQAWGGPELDLLTQFRVIEALAAADGSVGWCAMINCDGGYITAFLDQDVARAMYSDIGVGTAATATPTGRALPVPGGYRVSGRFPFASGCLHCEWVWLGCIVTEDGKPRVDGNGIPLTRQCMVKLSQCEILDTWYTTGLRGTGSNDLQLADVFVPDAHTFSFGDSDIVKRHGPLYAFPFLFAAKGPAPALGIARHAIDALVEVASRKDARRYILGHGMEPPKLMRDDVFVQEAVGRAETMLAAARAHLFDVMGNLWRRLTAGEAPSAAELALFSTASAHVIGSCVDVVELAFKAAGGTAVYQKGPFDRCVRDVLTMNQHLIATLRSYEMAGRHFLGLEPLRWLL